MGDKPSVRSKSSGFWTDILAKIMPALIISALGGIYKYLTETNNNETITLALAAANFIVLVLFLVLLLKDFTLYYRTNKSAFSTDESSLKDISESYHKAFQVTSGDRLTADFLISKQNRVNVLVRQIKNNIFWFCFLCGLSYVFIFSQHFMQKTAGAGLAIPELICQSATDLGSLWNTFFIFLAFLGTVDLSLDDENKKNYYWVLPLFFLIVFSIFYLMAVLYCKDDIIKYFECLNNTCLDPSKIFIINRFRLAIGFCNALSMSLLFFSYIGIHQFTAKFQKKLPYLSDTINIGVMVLLPIYAISQVFYGNFAIPNFGDKIQFANFVFFIYLIGKIFFLATTYKILEDKSLHIYLHTVLTRRNFDKQKIMSLFHLDK